MPARRISELPASIQNGSEKPPMAAGEGVTHHPARALRCLAAPSETKEFTSRMTAF